MSSLISKKFISKIKPDGFKESLEDFLGVEKILKINVNNQVFSLSISPSYIKELIIGFLISQNILDNSHLIKNLDIFEKNNEIIANIYLEDVKIEKNCRNVLKSNFKIKSQNLFKLFKDFQKNAKLFKLTGAFHSAALAEEDRIIFLVEDISRNNTIDKIIGYAFLKGISLSNKLLLVSCRISYQIVSKIVKTGIPIVVSRSAPTSLAVELAEKSNITVIGFLREERFNVYSHSYRIII